MRAFAFVCLGGLGPHLTHIFKNHVHMTIEGLDSAKDLAIVTAIDENLRVSLDCFSEEREGTLMEGVLLRGCLLFVSLICHLKFYILNYNSITHNNYFKLQCSF